MGDGPYRPDPSPEPGPPFSPLRPIWRFVRWVGSFVWWYLTATTWTEPFQVRNSKGELEETSNPTAFGCLGTICAAVCVAFTVGAFFVVDQWTTPVIICGVFVLLRAWLRAAMHLDDPEAMARWRRKFGASDGTSS